MWGGILLGLLVFASSPVHQAQAQSGPPGSGWVLTFDDEFNGNSLDLGKWECSTGQTSPNSAYDPSAVVEGNGVLQILTYLTDPNGPVTSANTTTGQIDTANTFTQTYGWFEFRCKMAPGVGMDEATWMFSHGGPYQEIDMPEWLGRNPNTIYLAHLYGPSWYKTGYSLDPATGPDWSAEFHTYAVNWQPDSITFYVDGIQYSQTTDQVPQGPMYLLISSGATSNAWGGDINASTCPNSMVIDYVRVYQGGGTTPPVPVPPPNTLPPSPAPLSPDGSVIYAGKGGSLVTSDGTWIFGGVSTDGVDSYTELNGVVVGWAAEMEIVGGSLYAHNTVGGDWFRWQNGTWVDIGPTAPSSPSVSPNASVLQAGQGGSLVTSDGTWTFGGAFWDGVDYYTKLNGVVVGWAAEMEIVSGSLYAHNAVSGNWFLWQNSAWVNVGPTAP
ncbi:MAG TPA: glycoside hydrolase family 16 protein [Planctomycetota bacterium]|nr:glycoside hydrolase family 16 protein [Planctomycetota bacterium]